MEEIEVVFLDVEPEEVERELKRVGAKKKFDRVFKKTVFDFADWRLNAEYAWLRLRDEGDGVRLAYKRRVGPKAGKGGSDLGMEEVEVEVSDFKKMTEILQRLGMVVKFEQEQRRIEYELEGVKVDIDFRPLLAPFVEIEGETRKEVLAVAGKLGFRTEEAKVMPAWEIYKLRGIEEADYRILTFEKQVKRE